MILLWFLVLFVRLNQIKFNTFLLDFILSFSFRNKIVSVFGRDAKSRWSILLGVYVRGVKYSTLGVNV